ncbi:DNA repair protein [Desulfotomaculum sp. 1211_IL3151]|uniref:DNA repair protein n=1 Tax=Desulfotomaculum sp. 1211_IL3151 TaxID=3084055 RepID=UPI002FD938FF
MVSPYIILALWVIAMTLGVIGVVARKKILLKLGLLAAFGGVVLTLWLKSTL